MVAVIGHVLIVVIVAAFILLMVMSFMPRDPNDDAAALDGEGLQDELLVEYDTELTPDVEQWLLALEAQGHVISVEQLAMVCRFEGWRKAVKHVQQAGPR